MNEIWILVIALAMAAAEIVLIYKVEKELRRNRR